MIQKTLSKMASKWPSAIVSRSDVGRFSGGMVSPKTMSNRDGLGLGPAGSFKIGSKVAYPVSELIRWLKNRSSAIDRRMDA